MNLAGLIATYGYLAVAVGTFLEGETMLLMAGFVAHRGYLDLWKVILAAFVASFLGDQFYFFLGRRYGDRILARFPSWKPQAKQVQALLGTYHTALVLAIRFLYGVRTLGPIVIGMSRRVPLFRLGDVECHRGGDLGAAHRRSGLSPRQYARACPCRC